MRYQQFLKITKLRGAGFNVAEACEKVGISRPTYYKWLKKDTFTSILSHALVEQTLRAQSILLDEWPTAVQTLLTIIADDSARAGERVKAIELAAQLVGYEPQKLDDQDAPDSPLGKLLEKLTGPVQINVAQQINVGSQREEEVVDGEIVEYCPTDPD